MNEGLSIIIPVFNEERSILTTLSAISKIMQNSGITYELIVVNDASTDATPARISAGVGNIKILHHKQNKGYGAALKTGIRASTYNIAAITDADQTYPNERIPEFYHLMKDYGMVVGQRSFSKLPLLTRPAKWFITRLANYLTETKIPDINSGLRLFRKKHAKRFFPLLPDGFSFTSTITIAMLSSELPVKYVPIKYYAREGKSKIQPFYDTLNFIQLIIRTIIYFNPLKIFIPLFLFFIALAAGVFVIGLVFFDLILNVTVSILFTTGVNLLAVGMLADLIDKRVKKS